MQFQLAAFILPLLSLSASAAPLGEESRVALISAFTVSTAPVCLSASDSTGTPLTNRVTVGYGSACGKCVPVAGSPGQPAYNIIQDTYIHSLCRLRLYQKPDCSDDGAISGPNCWTPDGGIRAYKVDCPYWPEQPAAGSLAPCA